MRTDDRFEDMVASLGGFYRTWYVYVGLELGLLQRLREADIAISLERPQVNMVVTRKLTDYCLGLYAAPAWLAATALAALLLVGGGLLKIVNNTVPLALQRLGYSSAEIGSVLQYIDEVEGTGAEAAAYLARHTGTPGA